MRAALQRRTLDFLQMKSCQELAVCVWSLGLVGLVRNVKVKGSLGCSD